MTARDSSVSPGQALSGPVEQRVLILAPTGNDARLTQRFLTDANIHSKVVRNISSLCDGIAEGCGTLLLAEETLSADTVEPLLKTISQQPSWSDIPLVLITSGGETSQTRLRRITTLGPVGNVTMLERPFRPVTLLSAIETALRARAKQYQVRDLLIEVQTSERQVQSVLASIADGFVALDKEWRFTYLNAAYLKLIAPLYSSAEALLGENLWEKFPDLAGTEVEDYYRKAMASQKPVSFELLYTPISTWLELRVYPAPDALSIYVRDITERKSQEESLSALTHQVSAQAKTFDTTLSNITDFAYILNREAQFLYANKPLLDLWGLQLHEAKGKSFFDLKYPVALAAKLQREVEHVFTTQEIVRGETPYTSSDGKDGYYEYIFSPVLGPDGAVEVIAGSTRVITERKRAEALGERRRLVLQLIAEDAPLEKIFESLAHMVELEARFEVRVGIQLVDARQKPATGSQRPLTTPSDRAVAEMKITQENTAFDSNPESQRSDVKKPNIATDPTWSELRVDARRHGLNACWSTMILSGQGEALGTFAIFHEKSHELSAEDKRLIATAINTAAVAIGRKRAEQALRASEAQLRLVTDHASVYLLQCDREHRYKFANRAYALRFAREPQALLGVRAEEIMGAKAYAEARPHMDLALAGERVEFEHEIAFGGSAPRWMHTVYIPEYAKDGGVVGFVGVINDVTARKQSELELMRARDKALEAARAKDDFLAALSHELRTPLNPVLLIASEAANDPELPVKVREDFETIARNATLEARLIDDLLDLTRITHGKMSLDKRAIDLHAVLADALETVAPDLREKKQTLNVKLAANDCYIFGDPARVQQIFWNVLKNAVKFTPQGGAITVETRCDKNTSWCAVCIQDSGIGMTEDEVGRVFDAFSQGNHAHGGGSHRFGGLGLGLAISRMLIDLHAGKISAASKGKDKGSTFTIEFPRVPADAGFALPRVSRRKAPERASSPPVSNGKTRRILVVEDHVATRISLTRLLARRGYEIVGAGTVTEALDRASEISFDLVVSDIGLPDGDGYSLMNKLRDKHGLTGIALSGYGMEQDIARGRAAGFTEHLIKPVNIDSLDRVLRAWEEALP
jgi:PAS domain S-box-containing protein